ncbi:MAG: SAM-dependent chlorinase/fluorinase, partial [Patescibacteria group bacterium]|nr:SAM-dependent chlorinase/fluorinase [Patescibacteria group bacterium]
MKKLIVIADWVDDSLTCQEFKSAFEGFLTTNYTSDVFFVSSTPSTLHTAFLLNQIVETEERLGRPMQTVIFINTDPRLNIKSKAEKSQGAKFTVARLKTGIFVCGPNAGYCYSMIKNKIDGFYLYQGLDKGSQFRSRDLYSRVCAHLVEEKEEELEFDEYFLSEIPAIDDFYVCHIDNFDNIKTNIKESDLKGKFEYGDFIKIKINQVEKKTKYVDNLFGGEPGELVIYPGSSGNINDRFLEITIWRYFNEKKITTGKDEFKNPLPGMRVR